MRQQTENTSASNLREMQADLERLERREWWRWATALVIMFLLTVGVLALSLPGVRKDSFTQDQLDLAVRGLFALVLVFDVFVIYQQLLISRLRRQLAGQMGMLAALEILKPSAPENPSGRRERRRGRRLPFDQRLKVKATVNGKETDLFGRIIDISEFGLAAVLSGSLDRGKKVILEFSAGVDKPTLTLPAIIRHAQGFRHGCEFIGLSSAEVDHLKRICASAGPTITVQQAVPGQFR